jgi:DNA-binding SARP family transcriptional activator
MEFTVLGPVDARVDQRSLNLGPPKQRTLLAALLLHAGRVVSTGRLIDLVWGEHAPSGAAVNLQKYVSQLRKAFVSACGDELIVTRAPGYLLRDDHVQLDLIVFRDLLSRAEAVDSEQRRSWLLGEALLLWRGKACEDIESDRIRAEAAYLDELRLQAIERKAEADLSGGHADAVASDISATVDAEPFREHLRSLLITALCRSGRRADALAVYESGRRLMRQELGIDPGVQLRNQFSAILADEGDRGTGQLRPGSRQEPADGPRPLRPSEVPAPPADFVGRQKIVDGLLSAMADSSAPVSQAIFAGPGLGKSSVAQWVAYQARDRFPDGQLFADLRAADPSRVLTALLRGLGLPAQGIPATMDERAALYRSVLSDRRVLVVLDNVDGHCQVHPLLPSSPGSAALVTSRTRLVGFSRANSYDLGPFSVSEAVQLLAGLAGMERVEAEPRAAVAVVQACELNPFAVRIAGAKLEARPQWTVGDLAAKLLDDDQVLDELSLGEHGVQQNFTLACQELSGPQRDVLAALAGIDGAAVTLGAVAAVLGRAASAVEPVLESLVDRRLVDTPRLRVYHCGRLLRLSVRELTK